MLKILLVFILLFHGNFITYAKGDSTKKQKNVEKINRQSYIPLTYKIREFIPPEKVGLDNNFPLPVVKEKIKFRCSCCKLQMSTHILYTYLPYCPKDNCLMIEID